MNARRPARGRPILITGAHRSGSTWVGRMLATSGEANYIHEPFNPKAFDPGVCELRFEREFEYVCHENAASYRDALDRCLRVAPRAPLDGDTIGARLSRSARRARNQLFAARPLMKDPHAVFSAEWLADAFEMDVVVLVRHPAAFVGSLKKAGWTYRFEQLLEQPLLMSHHLDWLRSEIESASRGESDIIDQGILLWNAIYGTVDGYRTRHPEWSVCRHEDLSREPERAFADLFGRLGLRFSSRARRVIVRSTSARNPAEQHAGNPLERHSRANIYSWRHRLCPDEIERVRKGTEAIAARFYGDGDWTPSSEEPA